MRQLRYEPYLKIDEALPPSGTVGDRVQLKLTPEQQEAIREATGKLTDTLELSIEALEERIAPALRFG
jgi:hypothetical protein